MKAILTTVVLSCLLLNACQESVEPEPVLDCMEGTVLGTDCGVAAGAGYFIQINQPIPEARSRVNTTTGATEYIVSTINVPAAYKQTGSHFFFTLRRATSQELGALGPVIALCDQSWQVMFLENAGDKSCASK